ncbi:MAG: PVC-type heme-binding CxxCH protein [Verrucomicrobiota bacterium]
MKPPIFILGSALIAAVPFALAVPPGEIDLDPDKSAPKQAEGPKLKVEKFADAPDVRNITAFCFDENWDLYLTETHRFRRGVEDNRNHRYWLMEDIKARTTEDRRKMFEKWEPQLGTNYFTKFKERVLRLRDTDRDGVADEIKEFASGFNDMVDGPAIGIVAGGGKIYMACIPNIWLLEDTDGDGVADKHEVFQDGFGPKVSLSGHDLHGMIWGPDGKLYFSIGDRGFNLTTREGNVLEDVNSGAVFRCDADGSNLEVFFHGLRNPQEIAFNEYGDLFTVDNNSDQGDQSRICYLIEGGTAGWTVGNQHLTTFKDDIEDGGLGEKPFWLTENLWKPQHKGQPKWIIPPLFNLTDGPSGLVFDSGIALPNRYKNGHFLICDYKGSAAQSFLWSFQVERDGAGYKVKDPHVFFAGVTNTDVDLGPDSKIYLADYGGGWRTPDRGAIYVLSHEETQQRDIVSMTEKILRSDFGKMNSETLGKHLAHPDMRVRQRAQFELVKQEDSETLKSLTFNQTAGLFSRLHGVWGLRQLKKTTTLRNLAFTSKEPEITTQAARALGDLLDKKAVEILNRLLKTGNERVKTAAAISLGKILKAHPVNAELEETVYQNSLTFIANGGNSPFLAHAGNQLMSAFCTNLKERRSKLGRHFELSPRVRLTYALALRKERSPYLTAFLHDSDIKISQEAIRGVNDLEFSTDTRQRVLNELSEYTRKIVDTRLSRYPYPVYLRLLNGCLRSGRGIDADTLLLIAEKDELSLRHRLKALAYLGNFLTPPPVDPTLGIYRPLAPRENLDLPSTFQRRLFALIDGENPRLASSAMKVAEHFDMAPDAELLVAWVRDEEKPAAIRLTSTELLGSHRDPEVAKEALLEMTKAKEPKLRAAAIRSLATAAPGAMMEGATSVIARDSVSDRRAVYEVLTGESSPEAAKLLAKELDNLIAGTLRRELELDLYEAVIERPEPVLKSKVDALLAKLAAEGKTDAKFTLFGGDALQGENVFNNQGTCLKCHVIGRMGGETGPELTYIATERTREHMLESLINPNTEITEGFGICSVVLKDGTTLAGSPLSEDGQSLTIKTAEAEPQVIAKADIATRTPTISPMPPMGIVLPKQDLRDLMAYLVSLDQTDDE